jgi:hypothetical protein
MQKLARFDANQIKFIEFCIVEGLSNRDILIQFKAKFFPDDGYCESVKERELFSMRITKYRAKVEKSNTYKELLVQARRAFAQKDHRLLTRNNQISSILTKLAEYADVSVRELSQEDFVKYKDLQALLLNALKDIAMEMGEFKNAQVKLSYRQQGAGHLFM